MTLDRATNESAAGKLPAVNQKNRNTREGHFVRMRET